MLKVHTRVTATKPDGYHLRGVIISTPSENRPYYSVDFECSDGHIENLWLEEGQIAPLVEIDPYLAAAVPMLIAAARQAHAALLERKPHSVPGGEQACEALFQALTVVGAFDA